MVGQVKVVGILMIVNGVLLILMGGFYAAMGSMFAFGLPGGPPPGGGGPPPGLFLAIYGVIGGSVICSGLLNAVAGYRVMTFRNRVFGIIALFSNILGLLTCYCALTAIGMMVYGLIVLFHSDVVRAFDAVSRGATSEEVIGRYTRVYDDVRDDYDDMSSPRGEWEERRRRRLEDDLPDEEERER
jgi:hypothetical protein